MTGALIILASVIIVGIVLYTGHRYSLSKATKPEPPTVTSPPESDVCCGMHVTCEKDSLLAAVSGTIIYYDDEELDCYAGRDADDYTDEEIDRFRDVLLTLLPEDIAGWGRSIQLRGITLPAPVRDELLLIVAEARQSAEQNNKP